MNRFLAPAVLLAALAAPASAQLSAEDAPPAGGVSTAAGQVASDGQILAGSGFTVRRRGPGEYEVIFPHGFFSSGCAALVVQGTSSQITSTVTQRRCPQRNPLFYVDTFKNGLLSDENFAFIAAQENR